MVMGNSKNLCLFNFTILFKSRKFDAKYTRFTVLCFLSTLLGVAQMLEEISKFWSLKTVWCKFKIFIYYLFMMNLYTMYT